MSQDNVEIVRRYVWAFQHDADTFIELTDPDIEWAPFEENHTVFRGVDGAMQIRTEWLETWAEHETDIEEIIDAGDDLVVAVHLVGRGKGSGLQVEVRLYHHVKLRHGRVVYIFEHEHRDEALKAVGLE